MVPALHRTAHRDPAREVWTVVARRPPPRRDTSAEFSRAYGPTWRYLMPRRALAGSPRPFAAPARRRRRLLRPGFRRLLHGPGDLFSGGEPHTRLRLHVRNQLIELRRARAV